MSARVSDNAPVRRVPRAMPTLLALLALAAAGCTPENGDETPTGEGSPTAEQTTSAEPGDYATVDVDSVDLREYEQDLFDETNAVRAEEDLPPLEHSDCAAEQGRERAEALVDEDGLEHAPMGEVQSSCDVSYSAENLVRSDAAPEAVVDAWMNSSGHRMNLLTTDAGRLGVGCVPGENEIICSQIYLGGESG